MTKEQEEVINKLKKITNRQILYGNKFGITIEGFRELQEDLETVLNMLKEKDAEIEKYKRKNKELSNQLLKIYKEQDNYNSIVEKKNEQIEKKDKMIDLLIDYIDTLSEYYTRAEGKNNEFCDEKCIDKNIDCYDCIKQYFERKAEQSSSINKTHD